MALTRDVLLQFVQEKLGGAADVQDDTLLFSTNLIDSFSLVDLILLIEQETKTKVAPFDVSVENLDSIARILRFVETRTLPPGVPA